MFDKTVLNKGDLIARQRTSADVYVLIGAKQYEKHKGWINENLKDQFYVVNLGRIDRAIRDSRKVYIWGAGKDW